MDKEIVHILISERTLVNEKNIDENSKAATIKNEKPLKITQKKILKGN